MERCNMHINLNNSKLSMQTLNSNKIHTSTTITNKKNYIMDLKKFSSRIICSDNIIRQNLTKKPSTSNVTIITDDDDDQFFKKIKSEIDEKYLLHSKENYKPSINYQNINLVRKKRPIIDKETQNVIKRFKNDTNHTNSVQSLNDTNIMQLNHINNAVKEKYMTTTNINDESFLQHENMVSSNILNTNFRIPASKYVFQVTSKLHTNILPSPINETTILHEEESLFYGMMFLTPPDNDSIKDNTDLKP